MEWVPLDLGVIRRELETLRLGRAVELYDAIDSTNRRASEWARAGALDGAVVLAERQTAGKGRLGRRWFAPGGSSLLMSIVLRPDIQPLQAQRMTMICSLGAAQAIEQLTGLIAALKWPNDLLLSGKKLGGVLTELGVSGGRLTHVIVGMGLNINLALEQLPEVMSPPTSLLAELGRPVDRQVLLLSILSCVDGLYDRFLSGWSPHEAWRERLDTIGREVSVGDADGVVTGVAEDVDADGALLVRSSDGVVRRMLAGDVTLRGERL